MKISNNCAVDRVIEISEQLKKMFRKVRNQKTKTGMKMDPEQG